jgi:hypothetical protein
MTKDKPKRNPQQPQATYKTKPKTQQKKEPKNNRKTNCIHVEQIQNNGQTV